MSLRNVPLNRSSKLSCGDWEGHSIWLSYMPLHDFSVLWIGSVSPWKGLLHLPLGQKCPEWCKSKATSSQVHKFKSWICQDSKVGCSLRVWGLGYSLFPVNHSNTCQLQASVSLWMQIRALSSEGVKVTQLVQWLKKIWIENWLAGMNCEKQIKWKTNKRFITR